MSAMYYNDTKRGCYAPTGNARRKEVSPLTPASYFYALIIRVNTYSNNKINTDMRYFQASIIYIKYSISVEEICNS